MDSALPFAEFMAHYAELAAIGAVALPCGVGRELLPGMAAAALAVDGGPLADDDAASVVWCCLDPGHGGLHYAVVRNLTAGAVWLRWRGPLCELVTLDDCALEMNGGAEVCSLFAGHGCSHR